MAEIISYTDPSWALNDAGAVDTASAGLERSIYGDGYTLKFGIAAAGRYVLDEARLGAELSGSSAVIAYRVKIGPEFLGNLGPGCRVFARQGVGTDTLDLAAISEYGAFAFNVPDYCVDETSTHTLALLLALERDICRQDQLIRSGNWSIRAGRVPMRLSESTLGIVGFGTIGRAVTRKAQPFFGKIVAYDPNVHRDLIAGYGAVAIEQLDELLEVADIVSLHASLTPSSERFINAGRLQHFRSGALLVNTARGGLVEASDVLQALQNGRLGGYATDVYSPERPYDTQVTRELASHSRVISSCHRGFLSDAADVSVRRRVAEEVKRVLETGNPPSYGRII